MFNWLSFLVFILACFGLTQILAKGKIFSFIRPKHHFFHCSMCLGFWVGILLYVMMWAIDDAHFVHHIKTIKFWGKAFIMGCLSSGTSYALSSIFSDEGINVKNN